MLVLLQYPFLGAILEVAGGESRQNCVSPSTPSVRLSAAPSVRPTALPLPRPALSSVSAATNDSRGST